MWWTPTFPFVANGKAEQAGWECEAACIRALIQVQAERLTLLDDKGLIIKEYSKKLSHSGQPGLGDAFFKWLHENQANPQHCQTVPVTVHADRGFTEFPDEPRLEKFDKDDRMFVAVALARGAGPQVLNAVDRRSWWVHRKALKENGVNVVFLCPEFMRTER